MSLDTLAKLTLAPWLMAQGRAVRRRALALPEPLGPRQGQGGTGPALSLLIAGDSSAAGVGASHQRTALSGQLARELGQRFHLDWQLEARTGASSASTLAHLKSIPERHFDTALLILGVNDVTGNVSLSRWMQTQRELHDLLRTRFGALQILRTALPPMGRFPLLPQPLRWTLGQTANRFDRALARLCAEATDTLHIPFDLPHRSVFSAKDGFHPSEKAYELWASLIAARI